MVDKTDPQVFLNEAEEIAYDRQPKEVERGSILPFVKTEEGVSFGWPQWAVDAYNAVKLPSDTLKGYKPTAEDTTNFAFTVAGGGLGASKVVKPKGDVGMFLGEKAYGANLTKLLTAKVMDQKGADRQEIWDKTSWWKKPDGNWAWEVADNEMKLNPNLLKIIRDEPGQSKMGRASQVIQHPSNEGQQIVPDDTWIALERLPPEGSKGFGGSFYTDGSKIEASAKTIDGLRSTLLHEIQHSVQMREGWSGGSNRSTGDRMLSGLKRLLPKEFYERESINLDFEELIKNKDFYSENQYNQLYNKYQKDYDALTEKLKPIDKAIVDLEEKTGVDLYSPDDNDSWQLYRRNEGEGIAELTASRAKLTQEERQANAPWKAFGKESSPLGKLPREDELWSNPEDYEIYFLERMKYHFDNME